MSASVTLFLIVKSPKIEIPRIANFADLWFDSENAEELSSEVQKN